MQSLSVRYLGRVQGVGFRATVADLAREFAVRGRVSNVADGSVNLQAEGDEEELVRFQRSILQRLGRHIVDHTETWSHVEHATWDDFGIGGNQVR